MDKQEDSEINEGLKIVHLRSGTVIDVREREGEVMPDTGKQSGRGKGRGRTDDSNGAENVTWDPGEYGRQKRREIEEGEDCETVAVKRGDGKYSQASNSSLSPVAERSPRIQLKFLTALSTGVTRIFVKHSLPRPKENHQAGNDRTPTPSISECTKPQLEKAHASSADPPELATGDGNDDLFRNVSTTSTDTPQIIDYVRSYTQETFVPANTEYQQVYLAFGSEDSSIRTSSEPASSEDSYEQGVLPGTQLARDPRHFASNSERAGGGSRILPSAGEKSERGKGVLDGFDVFNERERGQSAGRSSVTARRFSTEESGERERLNRNENAACSDDRFLHRYLPTCNKTEDEGHDELSVDSSAESECFFSDVDFSRLLWRTMPAERGTIGRSFNQRAPVRRDLDALDVPHPLGSMSSSSSDAGKKWGRRRTRPNANVFSRFRPAPRLRRKGKTDKPPRNFSTPSHSAEIDSGDQPKQKTNAELPAWYLNTTAELAELKQSVERNPEPEPSLAGFLLGRADLDADAEEKQKRYLDATLELAELKRSLDTQPESESNAYQSLSGTADDRKDVLAKQKRLGGTGKSKTSTNPAEESERFEQTSTFSFTRQSAASPRKQPPSRHKTVLSRWQRKSGNDELKAASGKTSEHASAQSELLDLHPRRPKLKTDRQKEAAVAASKHSSTRGEFFTASRNSPFRDTYMFSDGTYAHPGFSRIPTRWHETTFTTIRLNDKTSSKCTTNKAEPETFFRSGFPTDGINSWTPEADSSEEAIFKTDTQSSTPYHLRSLDWNPPPLTDRVSVKTTGPVFDTTTETSSDASDTAGRMADSNSVQFGSNALSSSNINASNSQPPIHPPRPHRVSRSSLEMSSSSEGRPSLDGSQSSGHHTQGSDDRRTERKSASLSSSNEVFTSESEVGPLVTFPKVGGKAWKVGRQLSRQSARAGSSDAAARGRQQQQQQQPQQLHQHEHHHVLEGVEGRGKRTEAGQEEVSALELRRRFSAEEYLPASPYATHPKISRTQSSVSEGAAPHFRSLQSQRRSGRVRQLSLDIGEEWENVNSPASPTLPSPTPSPQRPVPILSTDNSFVAAAINDDDGGNGPATVRAAAAAAAYSDSRHADRKYSLPFPLPPGGGVAEEGGGGEGAAGLRRQSGAAGARAVPASPERPRRAGRHSKAHQTSAKLRLLFPRDPRLVVVSPGADPDPSLVEMWRRVQSTLTAQELMRLRREDSPLLRLLGEAGGVDTGDRVVGDDAVAAATAAAAASGFAAVHGGSDAVGGETEALDDGGPARRSTYLRKGVSEDETKRENTTSPKSTCERECSSGATSPETPDAHENEGYGSRSTSSSAELEHPPPPPPPPPQPGFPSPVSHDATSRGKPVVTVQPMPQFVPGVARSEDAPPPPAHRPAAAAAAASAAAAAAASEQQAAVLPEPESAPRLIARSCGGSPGGSSRDRYLASLPLWKRRQLPNPFNVVNQRCHSTMQCPCCFFFCFLCCLPAVFFMGRSDDEFDNGSVGKARRYGRRTTVMYVVGAALAVVVLAASVVVTVLFLQDVLLRRNGGTRS